MAETTTIRSHWTPMLDPIIQTTKNVVMNSFGMPMEFVPSELLAADETVHLSGLGLQPGYRLQLDIKPHWRA